MKHIFPLILLLALISAGCASQPMIETQVDVLPLDPTQENDWLPGIPTQTQAAPPATQPAVGVTPEPTPTPVQATGVVNVDALNLRLGPGLEHQVLRLLNTGDALEITGRSENSLWLQVKLADGAAGWVYAEFMNTQTTIADLPLREAYGGPVNPVTTIPENSPAPADVDQSPVSHDNPDILVVIENNQAEVNVKGFPSNAELNVRLGLPGAPGKMVVSEGKADRNGRVSLIFSMPYTWADGAPLTSGDLILEVVTQDGSFSQSVIIEYYR